MLCDVALYRFSPTVPHKQDMASGQGVRVCVSVCDTHMFVCVCVCVSDVYLYNCESNKVDCSYVKT